MTAKRRQKAFRVVKNAKTESRHRRVPIEQVDSNTDNKAKLSAGSTFVLVAKAVDEKKALKSMAYVVPL